MRKVSRGANVPTALQAKNSAGTTELERARTHHNDPNPKKGPFAYAAYKHEEVKRRLDELFHGKCAYCETFYSASAPVDIEHYRPKGAVNEDEGHSGYWWLAMAWDNLLPSCIDCNRKRTQMSPRSSTSLIELYRDAKQLSLQTSSSGKKDSFPLAKGGLRLQAESTDYASEKALLLDPTRDDPTEHLQFYVDFPLSLVFPADIAGSPSERGAMSIQIYGLNRLGLVQDRTRLLRRLEFLGDLVIDLGAIIQTINDVEVAQVLKKVGVHNLPERLCLLQERTLAEIRDMADPKAPYSEMVKAWINKFLKKLA
ncbi:MAG: HNH endonuclease [Proteobacteria bacterium]|nr:HNH endonuclease [Pseudomonadota bacterium]